MRGLVPERETKEKKLLTHSVPSLGILCHGSSLLRTSNTYYCIAKGFFQRIDDNGKMGRRFPSALCILQARDPMISWSS